VVREADGASAALEILDTTDRIDLLFTEQTLAAPG